MLDRPDNFLEAKQRLEERDEAPVLSELQAEVMNSGYVDSADDVLHLLERSKRVKADSLDINL